MSSPVVSASSESPEGLTTPKFAKGELLSFGVIVWVSKANGRGKLPRYRGCGQNVG